MIFKPQFRYIWAVALIVYCGFIYYLSDQSRWIIPVPDLFDMQDKLIHATAYAVMAFLFLLSGRCWMIFYGKMQWHALAVTCVLFCAIYGLSDEWHQSFVVGRDASFFDWMADALGALLLTIMLTKREFTLSRASSN